MQTNKLGREMAEANVGMMGDGRVPGRRRGFTLIELMMVVAIISILAALALSGYSYAMKKSRRSTAQACLQADAQYLERFYATNLAYDETPAGVAVVLPDCNTDVSQFYTINFNPDPPTATTFTIEAVPVAGSSQAGEACGTMTINQLGVKTAAAPAGCW